METCACRPRPARRRTRKEVRTDTHRHRPHDARTVEAQQLCLDPFADCAPSLRLCVSRLWSDVSQLVLRAWSHVCAWLELFAVAPLPCASVNSRTAARKGAKANAHDQDIVPLATTQEVTTHKRAHTDTQECEASAVRRRSNHLFV